MEMACYLNHSNYSNNSNGYDENTYHMYIQNLVEINKNLRSQLENLYKLLKVKLKFEQSERLEKLLDELEIMKTSLSFSMQKQTNIVSN